MRLVDQAELWFRYGVDFDEVKLKDGDLLLNLIRAFISRKGRKRYLHQSAEEIRSQREKQIRLLLDEAYVEGLWADLGSGTEYLAPRGLEIGTNLDEGIISQKKGDYTIIWKLEPTIRVEGDAKKERIVGRKYLEAESILLKLSGSHLEVRASKKGRKFVRQLFENFDVQRIEVPIVSEDLNRRLEAIYDGSLAGLRLVKIKFIESSLPFRSKLSIENNTGVERDLDFLRDKKAISGYSVTDVREMTFEILSTGRNFKLTVSLLNRGYFLDILDKQLTAKEREEIKELFTKSGLPVRTVCTYDVEKNLKTIVHKILSGSLRSYEEYYSKLPNEISHVIAPFVKSGNNQKWICQTCGRQFNVETDICNDCGGDDLAFRKQTLIVDDQTISDYVAERFEQFVTPFQVDGRTYTFANPPVLDSENLAISFEFMRSEIINHATRSEPFTLTTIMYSGRNEIPKAVEDYLRFCTLVTYGEAAENERKRSRFGYIDLFDLICSKDHVCQELFDASVSSSIEGLETRVAKLSSEALQNLHTPENLKPKDFERDVFYLFKRLFPLSERLGKPGKKEADGLIIHVNQDGVCLISSYDAKHTKNQYDLESVEQNQAAIYILGERIDPRIMTYTKGKGISAHIMVSNNFDNTKAEAFLRGANQLLRLSKDANSIVPIVVISTRNLVDVFLLFLENLPQISGDQFVRNVFYERLWELLSSPESGKIVTHDEVKRMKEIVVNAASSSSFRHVYA